MIGSPFYSRSRIFSDDTGPPYEEAAVVNDYEAAHAEASTRVVAAESAIDRRPAAVGFTRIVVLAQAEYDDLPGEAPNTLYLIQRVDSIAGAADMEVWSATETAAVTVQVSSADTAVTVEGESSVRADADSSAAVEGQVATALVVEADTATSAETQSATVLLTDADTSTATESASGSGFGSTPFGSTPFGSNDPPPAGLALIDSGLIDTSTLG